MTALWPTLTTNPDWALCLLLAGFLLICLEFNKPGSVIFACVGLVFTLYAVDSLALHQLRPLAALPLLGGLAVLALTFRSPARRILLPLAVLLIAVGLGMLVVAPPISAALALVVATTFILSTHWLGWIALRARRNKSLVGPAAMVGKLAIVRTALAPRGQVEVRGELWQAFQADGRHAPAGTSVIVQSVLGLELLVAPSQLAPLNVQHAAPATGRAE
jgi:membrane-bound serine protease (ClpP class)